MLKDQQPGFQQKAHSLSTSVIFLQLDSLHMSFVLVAASRAYLSTERGFPMKKVCFHRDGNAVNGASWGPTSGEETDLHVQPV